MFCPSCGTEIEKLDVQAPARIVTLQMVEAEVFVDELVPPKTTYTPLGQRIVKNFRFAGHLNTLDNRVDHHDLELDDLATLFFAPCCQAEIAREIFEEIVKEAGVTFDTRRPGVDYPVAENR